MTVIQLLNKTANREKVPKKIKYKSFILERTKSSEVKRLYVDEQGMFFPEYYSFDLNDEVEIIEEDKKIKKVSTYVICDYDFKNKDEDNNLIATNIIDKAFEEYSQKINEIIDYINTKE